MKNVKKFREKYGPWALIAGGSEGLGRAYSMEAAKQGLNVFVVGRRENLLGETKKLLEEKYEVEVRTLSADLSAPEIVSVIDENTKELKIGLFVYNACSSIVGRFLSSSRDDHARVLEVNCRGPLLLSHYFGERMVREGRGGIILMSSMSGLQGTPMVASYASTKAFNLVLAESLWEEYRGYGVDVMACVAGATLTPNYLRTKSEGRSSSAPEMAPEPVVEEAFRRLGKTPSMIPGFKNKAAVFFLRRFLGKKAAVGMIAKNMYSQYGTGEE